jgi:large subunit ribosomal protein L10e
VASSADLTQATTNRPQIISKKWGFTPLTREEYISKRSDGNFKADGAYVQFLRNKGPLVHNMRRFPDATAFETEA